MTYKSSTSSRDIATVIAVIILAMIGISIYYIRLTRYVDEHQAMGHRLCNYNYCYWCLDCAPHHHVKTD